MLVINREDAGHPELTFSGITVEAGKTAEKTAEFSGGSLNVKAMRNGQPFSAYCRVLKAGTNGEEQKEVTNGWTDVKGASFKLPPGDYNVIVEDRDRKSNKEFNGLKIEAGKTQDVEAQL